MKTSGIILLSAFFIIAVACNQKSDPELEKKAIIDVINAETQAYMDYDLEQVISYYVNDSLNFRLTTGADDHVFLEGWKEVESFFREDLERNDPERPIDAHITVSKDNYRIKLYDHSAYVLCTETWTYAMTEDTVKIDSRQVRFMEKENGEWKIAFLSFIGTSGYEEEEELQEMGVGFNTVF